MGETSIQQLVPQATPALCKILTPIEGRLDEPIRSEIFGLQRFSQHGHSLGLTHRAVTHARSSVTFTPRLRSNISRLRAAYEYIGAQANAGYDISPAAEWLIENFHLLEAQFKEVSDGLPRSYFRTLPVLVEPPLKGLPRIYGVAWAFVAHTDGAFDEELLQNFLSAYQDNCELHLSELWALPTTLRVVLMENMRRLSERVAANKAARELANKVCDHLDRFSIQTLNRLVSILRKRGFDKVFLAHMAHRLQGFTKPHRAYQQWFNEVLPDLAGLQAQLRADQAADNLSVSNAVSSLRAIGDADWPEIVARTSVLIGLLLTSSLFASEHTTTRDATLHGIEQMARRLKRSERDVAQGLLDLINSSNPEVAELLIPSYWLEGQGFEQLLASLRREPPHWSERLSKAWVSLRPAHLWIYLFTAAVCTLAATAWLLRDALGYQVASLTPHWLVGLAATLMLFPVSEAVLALMQRLISESYQPRPLHRLAFSQGITHEHRTIVVIPCMLSDQSTTLELVHRLQLHFLANPEDEAQFALLTDWTDSPTETKPDDASLLHHAHHQIRALNTKYPRPQFESTKLAPRFLILHRPREFSPTEQIWIGRERKRGKLEQLISTLAVRQGSSFLALGEESHLLGDIQYVVTLDSDTQLPPGKLRSLVGIAAHPFNKPQLDPQGHRVQSGYGILQPRVVTPLPEPHSVTLFHWLFSGQIGMDPYSAACSEIYQDVFAEGTFCGKGLIHVRVAHQVLSARIPEGQVLSHDLLEGALARCASVTDVTLVEESPSHADVAASRAHRWMRGDWQLLPLLLNAKANGINGINQWKMVDNLRRSLVAPVSMALLVMALSGWVISPSTVLLVLLAAWSTGTWAGALAGLIPSRGHLSLRHFYAQSFVELQRALLASIWSLALLAQHSVSSVDAIARALYRTFFSRRHLLQWTTSAAAQGAAKTGLWPLIWQHRKQTLLTIALASVLVWVGAHTAASIALCLLWGTSPVWIWLSSRVPASSARQVIGEDDEFYLQGIARDTWRFFEHSVTENDRHLPPDNLQVMPYDMLAHRTSPTNIGLYLLSVACAREFGWISTQDLINRLNATMASLTTLNTYRGHFYNWYDTQTGAPLLPMYVSTVDSGNLSGHLLSVSEACRQWAASGNPQQDSAAASAVGLGKARKRLMPLLLKRHSLLKEERESLRWMLKDYQSTRQSAGLKVTGDQSQQLLTLAGECEALAWQPDFKFLYHPKRRLLHIGFRVQEHQLDASFYDLLASESRLASMLAIAKGDVPVVHWSALGRMFYALGTTAGLRSWSGSMFEYLMPSLILKEPESSVLQGAAWVAVLE